MNWNKTEDSLPIKPGFYLCYFHESAEYYEHYSDRWFDGANFRSGDSLMFWTDTRMFGSKINHHISHWMKIDRP